MAFTVNEKLNKRTANSTIDGYKAKRVFHVISDSPENTDQLSVLLADDVPSYGDSFPYTGTGTILTMQQADVSMIDDEGVHWLVECIYADYVLNESSTDADEEINPLESSPLIEFSHETYERVVEYAYDSGDSRGSPTKLVANTLGELFDPPIVQEESVVVIRITQNESSFSESSALYYMNTMNKSSVSVAGLTIPARYGRIRNIGATKKTNTYLGSASTYWEVVYEIEVHPDGQVRKILNAGYKFKDDEDKTRPIQLKDGVFGYFGENVDPVDEPHALNEDGTLTGADGDAHYLEFYTYFETSWGGLALPASS